MKECRNPRCARSNIPRAGSRKTEKERLPKVNPQARADVDRHAYRLTDAGRALFPIVVAFMHWGDAWISGAGNELVRLCDRPTVEEIAPVTVTSRDSKILCPSDVMIEAGRGADADSRSDRSG